MNDRRGRVVPTGTESERRRFASVTAETTMERCRSVSVTAGKTLERWRSMVVVLAIFVQGAVTRVRVYGHGSQYRDE
jgi:hypothetical protein